MDVASFKQMRGEKVLPKRPGRVPRGGSDIEPFTSNVEQALTKLIKETTVRKIQPMHESVTLGKSLAERYSHSV